MVKAAWVGLLPPFPAVMMESPSCCGADAFI
jgi:hypothetical protein